jgi:hypothetical protein
MVEMLVSTALIIFVMVILTQVFAYGLQSLRNLRGVGSMQEQLRYATNILRRDLSAPHFGKETTALNGPYLSQQRADLFDWQPPREGFFRIIQGSNSVLEGIDGDGIPSFRAVDHALQFTVRLDMNAGGGTGRDQFFRTSQIPMPFMDGFASGTEYLAPDNQYSSRWAEIAYFLDPNGQQAGGANLYTLYRRKLVLLDSRTANKDFANTPMVVPNSPAGYEETLVEPSLFRNPRLSRYYYNTPADVTLPLRRFFNNFSAISSTAMRNAFDVVYQGVPVTTAVPLRDYTLVGLAPPSDPQFRPLQKMQLLNSSNQLAFQQANGGDDILLENVLSMEIRVNWEVPTDTRLQNMAVRGPRAGVAFDEPFDILPPSPSGSPNFFGNSVLAGANGPFVFDTWAGTDNYKFIGIGQSPLNMPLRIRVKAIQIRLRVWDIKTQQARQVTLVQDL